MGQTSLDTAHWLGLGACFLAVIVFASLHVTQFVALPAGFVVAIIVWQIAVVVFKKRRERSNC
ncbi:hypothetical protein [Curtobacterium sp. 9128]|uniref:hypothetical protein n=1 Tax=Curtobacterium sp. 9128 TaxID=1793722 RepID=UPI00119F9256|nr:hypothetical protein [Curtobacterium sp. 9128]